MKFNTKNSFMVPHDTLESERFLKLAPCCYILYITLCKIHNRIKFRNSNPGNQWFYHSLNQLSKKSGLSKTSIIKAKGELNENHFIDIEKGFFVNGRRNAEDYFRLNGFRMRDSQKINFENYQ